MSGSKKPASSVRISTTKRGTTIRASGSAAQALFDAMTAGTGKADPKAAPVAEAPKTSGGAS